jgi:hypothetical protein
MTLCLCVADFFEMWANSASCIALTIRKLIFFTWRKPQLCHSTANNIAISAIKAKFGKHARLILLSLESENECINRTKR